MDWGDKEKIGVLADRLVGARVDGPLERTFELPPDASLGCSLVMYNWPMLLPEWLSSSKKVSIDDFLQEWADYELRTMHNLGLVETFFRKGLALLNSDEKGYVKAFDAFTRCIVWRDLHSQGQLSLHVDITNTLGQYAQRTGKELCRSKRTANSEWAHGVERLTIRYAPNQMINFMQGTLDSPLSAPQKLHICKLGPLSFWQHPKKKEKILALLPLDERARLQELPWAATDVDEQIEFVRSYCPQLGSILENVLPKDAWQNKNDVLAFATSFKKAELPMPLPEDFAP